MSRIRSAIGAWMILSCSGQSLEPRTVGLCEVTADVRAFAGHHVRVTAFLGMGAEQAVLYDPMCQHGKPLVYVAFGEKVTGQLRALRRIIRKKHYALVTIDGTMRGGEPIRVDNLPDWLKERYKNSSQRYGHLGSLEMMIEVTRVVSARDEDDGLTSHTKTHQQ